MKQTIIVVVLCVFVSTVAFSQKNTDGEAVQYIPRAERIDRATLSGAELIADSKVKVSFSALPSSAMCGERCMARAILVVSLGIHGATNRYGHGRASFDASANLTVAGYNNDNLQWTYPTQQSLAIEGTATSTKPVATIVLDVTEYSDLACTAGAATSNDIVVTVNAIDTEGLTAEMVDSLVLTAELIQEYRILPYEGATLNCATDVYVKAPVIADTVHPVKLSWRVADGQTPCPDLYPTFEVEVLRLYNIDPNMRDSETKTRSVVDWRQAQRFLTYGPATSIEFTLAEGTGYYVWRVRPIGNYHPGGIANERNWGCWSMAPAQEAEIRFVGLSDMDIQQTNQYGTNKPFFFYRQFDRDKNWTFKRTFVEDGGGRAGIAEGITYASRLLQPLQVQTPVTTTADVLVQQTVLDYEGRPLVTTLAVPKTRNSAASAVLQYVPNLSTAGSSTVDFGARHFDGPPSDATSMSGRIGEYWSSNNSNTAVPSADGFPFQRTVLSNDPLSRPVEASSAGSAFKIGSRRTIRTSYSPATDRELVTMFGSDAPLDSAVSRVATTDQNGVTSISYVRFDGKTIATCLVANEGNSALLPLNDSSAVNNVVLIDTVQRGMNIDSRSIMAMRQIVLLSATRVTFDYFLHPDTLQSICDDFCESCEYQAKIMAINSTTLEVVYSDSVDASQVNCPGASPFSTASATLELQPGTYTLVRVIKPKVNAQNRTRVDDLKSILTSKHQRNSESLLHSAFTSAGHTSDLDSMRSGRHLTNDVLARRMLMRYRSFRDSVFTADSIASVPFGTCRTVSLDSSVCKTGCETDQFGRYSFEKLLYDSWADSVNLRTNPDSGRILAAYVRWFDGSPFIDSVNNGVLDSLVRLMVEEGGYDCAELYGCWQSVVAMYDQLRWKKSSSGTDWEQAGENIIQQFLDCAGTKYCSAAPFAEKVTGASWLLNAWRVMPYSPDTATNALCSLAVQVDSTFNCTTMDPIELNNIYRSLQACIAGADRKKVKIDVKRLDSLSTLNNPEYKRIDSVLTKDSIIALYNRNIDTCRNSCERRRAAFRDSVILLYNKEGYFVEGFPDRQPSRPFQSDTIRSHQLACMVGMIVQECDDQCSFPIDIRTVNNRDTIIRPNTDDLLTWQKASYATSFRMLRPRYGDTCPSDEWKHIERTVVLADLIVELLNLELETYKKEPGALISRWDARPIIERLSAEFPMISTACLAPNDSTPESAGSAPWTVVVHRNKPSRFFVERSSGECRIMYDPPAQDPSVQKPHPLVALLNNYLRESWGKKVSDAILDKYVIQSTMESVPFHSPDNKVTFYRVQIPVELIAETVALPDDPLKPRLACDDDGLQRYLKNTSISGMDDRWSMCDDTIACINGKTMNLRQLEKDLSFMSSTRYLLRLNPDDDSLYVVGDIKFDICSPSGFNVLFSIIPSDESDSIYRITWFLPSSVSTTEYASRTHTVDKLALQSLLNGYRFRDSIGFFDQTPEGRLAFRLNVLDSSITYTFGDCINFECTPPPQGLECRALPICNICDTVQCANVCFRWVDSDTLAPTVVSKPKTCAADELERLVSSMEQQMSAYLEKMKNDVDSAYTAVCFNPRRLRDHFTAERGEKYYHYTLYAYDRAGNLVETVPPSGFRPIPTGKDRRDTSTHVMRTSYEYNTLGQLVEQFTPDGGLTKFWYDHVGRLRLSQNARQKTTGHFSYTNYDALGRTVEVGQRAASAIGDPASHAQTAATTSSGTDRVVTTYTGAYTLPAPYSDSVQTHLRNRISRVVSDQDGDTITTTDQVATFYSYDAHGNVKWIVQSLPAQQENTNPLMTYVGYDYDLMSGKVRQVHYRPEHSDAFHQRYTYDHDGRVVLCETSRDGIVWVRDASYAYELHGPLRRIEIGQDSVQGIDYTYTINGWLKSINHPSSEPTMDAGRDGKPGTAEPHALFGRDAFGMMLTYHTDDFKHTGSFADAATTTAGNTTWHQTPLSSLYNGNIAAWSWSSRTNTGTPQPLASRYRYDVLNRIRVDTLSTRASTAWQATPNYRSSYTYDGNGNLKNLVRVDSAGTLMDSLLYTYQPNRNRLTHVDDPGGVAGNHSYDVDDQQADNYTYDATGNLTSDVQEGITSIEWTPSNKIRSITKGSTSKLEYTYDAAGNRVVKRFYMPANTLKHTTWYARDAQGNVLSIYERATPTSEVKQTEVHIYGSSRLGIEQRNITYSTSPFAWLESEQHRHAGTKRYELTDHLGNVRVTISDLLVPRPASSFGYATQDAEVIDRRDYYPFGMEMPGRRWRAATEGAGRFGFNGKENDNEVKGEGNQQDYGFRIYDPRVARFLSVDPLDSKYPNLSPYAYSANNPVLYVDGDGRDFGVYVNHSSKTIVIKQTIHTVAGRDAANAELGASKWNAQSGRWQYAVKSGKQTIVYDVEFEITVKHHEDEKSRDIAFSGDASREGNLFRALSNEEIEENPSIFGIADFATNAAGTGMNYAKVQDNQTAEDRRTFAHEIGHMLGLGHFSDGLMEDGETRGEGEVNNFVTLGNVSVMLSRVEIGLPLIGGSWQVSDIAYKCRLHQKGTPPKGFTKGAVQTNPDLIGPRFPDGGF